jgi:hypothetical protein
MLNKEGNEIAPIAALHSGLLNVFIAGGNLIRCARKARASGFKIKAIACVDTHEYRICTQGRGNATT